MEDELIVSSCPIGHFVQCERDECTHIMSIANVESKKIYMLATYSTQSLKADLIFHRDDSKLVGCSFVPPIDNNTGWKYCRLYKAEPITIEDIKKQLTF